MYLIVLWKFLREVVGPVLYKKYAPLKIRSFVELSLGMQTLKLKIGVAGFVYRHGYVVSQKNEGSVEFHLSR